jgi:hypothetical protein
MAIERNSRRVLRVNYEQPPDLTAEDEKILDNVWEELGREEQERLAKYAPVMTTLVDALAVLDSEAIPLPSGNPVGLLWYARHRRRQEVAPKNCRNEEDWSRRLKDLLNAQQIATDCERPYPPPPRRRCDLAMQWPGLGRVWLEVKGAWRHQDSRGAVANPSYRKHLYRAGDDLKKVCSLDESTADHIGLLLVGFDTTNDPIADKDIDIVRARPERAGWIEQYREWTDPHRQMGRVRVWLWLSEAKYAPDIFD